LPVPGPTWKTQIRPPNNKGGFGPPLAPPSAVGPPPHLTKGAGGGGQTVPSPPGLIWRGPTSRPKLSRPGTPRAKPKLTGPRAVPNRGPPFFGAFLSLGFRRLLAPPCGAPRGGKSLVAVGKKSTSHENTGFFGGGEGPPPTGPGPPALPGNQSVRPPSRAPQSFFPSQKGSALKRGKGKNGAGGSPGRSAWKNGPSGRRGRR